MQDTDHGSADIEGTSGHGPPPWWHDPRVPLAAGAIIVLLAVFGAWQAARVEIAEDRRAMLEARAVEGFLLPPSVTRTTRTSLHSPQQVRLGGGTAPEKLEILIDARSNRFNVFRVAISRNDGTAALRADRLQRDSNGDLRIALNSTLLPPGRYTIRIEGLTSRGEIALAGSIPLAVVEGR